MAAVLQVICALFLFLPLAKQEGINGELQLVIKALQGIIDFYESDYENLNVDGLFGLRVLEGHLDSLINKHKNGELQHLDRDVIPKLTEIKRKATNTCELALEHVKQDGENYYRQMSYVINSPWTVFDGHRKKVYVSLAWSKEVYVVAKKTVSVTEEVSDQCMSELIGSHKSNGSPCDISSKCAHTMTAPGLLGYGITHQILWTMLAEKAGCTEKLQARLFELRRGDLRTLREELCSNNYIQLKETLQKLPARIIVPSLQDLFLEQMFICPSLGYTEFLDLEFLKQILSWQQESGCYGKMKKPKMKNTDFDPALTGNTKNDYVDEQEQAALKFKDNNRLRDLTYQGKAVAELKQSPKDIKHLPLVGAGWEIPKNKGRKLLVEKTMAGGCLAHKTGVASGALVIFLRYLCEPDAVELFLAKRYLRSVDPHVNFGNQGEIVNGNKPVVSLAKEAKGSKFLTNQNGGLEIKANQKAKEIQQDIPSNRDPIENLQMNLNKEAEYPNSLERLKKFQNSFEAHNNELDPKNINYPRPMPKPIKLEPNIKDKNLTSQALVPKPINLEPENKNKQFDSLAPVPKPKNLEPVNQDKSVKKVDNKNDDNYEYKYDDNNDTNAGSDKNKIVNDRNKNVDNKEDYDNAEEDDDDEEYDDDETYHDYNRRGDGEIDRNLNEYYDHENDKDLKPNADNDKNPDDNDDDYNADDGYNDGYDDNDQENVHPHINARNIGIDKSPEYDKGYEEEKRLKQVKDYDDDEDGDDYEYDDDNAEMEQRRQEEVKNEFIGKADKKVIDSHRPYMAEEKISEQSYLTTTTFLILVISVVILIVLYRFLKKRRLRLKLGHKHFHV